MSEEAKTPPSPSAPSPEPPPDYYGQLLRLKAEFENYRKRVDRDRPEWLKMGRAQILSKLLPLYDVLRSAHEEVRAGHAESPLARGMDAIFREFEKIFQEEGVSQLDPKGKPFDPRYHEALGFADKPGIEEGAVAEVLQPGFLLGEQILRTAKVHLQKKKNSEAS